MTPSDDEIAAEEWAKACLDACDFKSWVEMTGEEYEKTVKNIFLAGAEHARAKWIKCSERMPPEGQWVLVSVNKEHGSEVEIDCTHIMDGGEIIWLVCQQSDRYPDVEFSDVTHWMPLPSAPEAERK